MTQLEEQSLTQIFKTQAAQDALVFIERLQEAGIISTGVGKEYEARVAAGEGPQVLDKLMATWPSLLVENVLREVDAPASLQKAQNNPSRNRVFSPQAF